MGELERLVESTHVFVDTCSFMHDASDRFFSDRLRPVLLTKKAQVIVPLRVVEEVNTLQKSHKAKTKADARRAAKIIKNYVSLGLVDIRGEEREPFADNVFHYVFSMLRTQYDLTLITQDTALAMEILALRHSKAIRSSKQLNVYRITQFGDIREWREGTEDGASGSPEHDRDMETKPLFRSCMRPRPNKDILIPVKTVPTVGDRVRVHGRGTTVLQKVLASGGGEGVIYSTSSGDACKIFHRERITEGRRRKLSLMASSPIEIDGVCWPIAPVLNGSDEFVGYLMPLAHGKPLQKCLFIKPLLVQNFPNWDRQQLVQLAITWLEKVIALHKNNVLIGDINPMNILVDSDARMYLVDTDSFQVEDFPCTVGMANFTAPEIQRRPFSSFLRTPEHEAFAVATMLFMILMPGKPPYSHQGGGDPISNIMSGNFSYPLGAESNRKTPDGPWRFIWSHFPYRTKEAFYNCFKEGKRLSPEEWASILRGYHYDLQSGHLDPSGESLKIFPTGFKQVSDYAHDKYGAEREKLVEFRCDICGNTFKVPAEKSAKFSAEKNKTCRDCYLILKQKQETTGDTITCSQCGKAFLFSLAEQEFYRKRELQRPKRCKECRQTTIASKTPRTAPSTPTVFDAIEEIWKSFWDR